MRNRLTALLLLIAATVATAVATPRDTTEVKKKTFGQRLLQPVNWIVRNWSAYDPAYSMPAFYNWALQFQNTTSMEWLRLYNTEGMDMRMRSKVSNRIGPFAGYRFIYYGLTLDLSSLGHSNRRKDEFTLAINSNLVNLDLIRRRTGGDFTISQLNLYDGRNNTIDLTDLPSTLDEDMGDHIQNSVTGFNLNVFTNHKKYSNPAAYSNGAIQLRSVGSPIIGLGYSHQKAETDISDLFFGTATILSSFLLDDKDSPLVNPEIAERLSDLYDTDRQAYNQSIFNIMKQAWPQISVLDDESRSQLRSLFITRVPTVTRVDDWHLQLGYAYNLVFSRRLLLGMTLIASPGAMRMRVTNAGSMPYELSNEISQLIKEHEGTDVPPESFRYDYDKTSFNVNTSARLSLTYNHNRWRAGLNAQFNGYYNRDQSFRINNSFGRVTLYAGYCFGRKKQYRHDGKKRQEYITTALTPAQIEEMRDTMPTSNLGQATAYAATYGTTRKYHNDEFDINIYGCDLVKGPDGRYGWFELTDGYVTPGQDTDGQLTPGSIMEIDREGRFTIKAGHHASFRAGNWWKSQLRQDQMPNHWYPELLNYALSGRLTLYLRGRIFSTKKPVRLTIDDFYINHGKEAREFSQMGIRSYRSNSTYSIEGRATIDGRDYRVYIEQTKRGGRTNMHVSRVYPANANWMADIDGSCTLSNISMPGTHDSGSASLAESPIFTAGHTQCFSVADQLYDGIRAFDIRLKKSLKYGHTMTCRDSFDSTLVAWDRFLADHPSECIVAMVGSDEGGKWEYELTNNYKQLITKYKHRFVESFTASTPLDSVRGKILVIRRQEGCPFGKLLRFADNAVFDYDCFRVEDVYKEHKTWRKLKLVEQNIRDAYESDDPNRWFITFCSIAWSPRRHTPYSYAWGEAKNIRKPINSSLREVIEQKDYTNFGIVFLDFYNNRGDSPQVVESIIKSNFDRYE